MVTSYMDKLIVASDTLRELRGETLVPVPANGQTEFSDPREMVVLGDQLMFTAQGDTGRELWSYDNSQFAVASQINQAGVDADPRDLTVVGDALFFSAEDVAHGRELWRYSASAGTHRVSDLVVGEGDSNPTDLVEFQGQLYFSATAGIRDRELYRFDGQAISRVADLFPGTRGSSPAGMTRFGNLLVFSADDGQYGTEPWQYDGQNLTLIEDLAPGLLGSTFAGSGLLHDDLILDWNGSDFVEPGFLNYDGVGLTYIGATAPGLPEPRGRILAQNDEDLVLLAAFASAGGGELHLASFDGTTITRWPAEPFSTFLISDVAPMGDDLIVGSDELWSFDGQSYHLLADLLPEGASRPRGFVTWQNDLYFLARSDLSTRYQVWKYDGQQVTQISDVKDAVAITVYNNQIHFVAEVSLSGEPEQYAVYRYQGGSAKLLQQLPPDQQFLDWKALGSQLYVSTNFYNPDTQEGYQSVWRMNALSVEEVAQFHPNAPVANSSTSGRMTTWNNELFVVADDGDGYGTLWRTDGSTWSQAFESMPGGGPRVLVGFNTLFPYQDQLLIVGDDGTYGSELWRVQQTVPGDSNGDGVFDSGDLLLVFQIGKYEDGIPNNATFAEGDWNEDGDFDTSDLVYVFQAGTYVASASPMSGQIAAAVDRLFADDPWVKKDRARR